jgi:hypothetical protein
MALAISFSLVSAKFAVDGGKICCRVIFAILQVVAAYLALNNQAQVISRIYHK